MTALDRLLARWKKQALDLEELAIELDYRNPASIRNAISAGRFPIPTYRAANGKRVADVRDVAEYFERSRESA